MALLALAWGVPAAAAPMYYLEPIQVSGAVAALPSEQVWTARDIEATGAADAAEALRRLAGLMADEEGTRAGHLRVAVYVNDVPLANEMAYADLRLLPADRLASVRVSRSDELGESGGTVRLTLRAQAAQKAMLAGGNGGREKALWTYTEGGWRWRFGYDRRGRIPYLSAPSYYRTREIAKFYRQRSTAFYTGEIGYTWGDAWEWSTKYSRRRTEKEYIYAYKPVEVLYDERVQRYQQWQHQLQYKKGDWRIRLTGRQTWSRTGYQYYDYEGLDSSVLVGKLPDLYIRRTRNERWAADVRYEHDFGAGQLILRNNTEYNRYGESMLNRPIFNYKTGRFDGYREDTDESYSRILQRFYAGYRHTWRDRHMLYLGFSDLRTFRSPGEELHGTMPRAEYRYLVNKGQYWYLAYRESYTVPSLDALYGLGLEDRGGPLYPSEGRHYEAGYAWTRGDSSWKAFVFRDRTQNDVRYKVNWQSDLYAVNAHTRNAGLTIRYRTKQGPWRYGLALTWQDPTFYEVNKPQLGWRREYGHIRLTGDVSYQHAKWAASLRADYLGSRVLSSQQEYVRPLLTTNLSLTYAAGEHYEAFLEVDNVLNRRDVTSHISTRYFANPRSFLLGLTYRW